MDKVSFASDGLFHGGPDLIRGFDRDKARHGFFFADKRAVAEEWARESSGDADGFVLRARVALEDALVIDAGGAHWSEIPDPWRDDLERPIDEIVSDAEAAGFDGVVVNNIQDAPDTMDGVTNTTVIAFSPAQVTILEQGPTPPLPISS